MASDAGYLDPADICIGELFARSPVAPDGAWPHNAIYSVIEAVRSETLEQHVRIGKRNSRGVVSRSPDAGGAPERVDARKYRGYAEARRIFPRSFKLLTDLANDYAREAKENDARADICQDL